MRGTMLMRTCPVVLSLLHLGLFVSLFVPPPGPYSEVPWQVLFKQTTVLHQSPAVIAGFVFLPLLLPLFASWVASRSEARMKSLILLWSSLPLLLVSWAFSRLESSANDMPNFLRHWGWVLSFLLILLEAISLARVLGSQKNARVVNQPERLLGAQDEPARQERPNTRRSPSSLSLLLVLVLLFPLCYLLVFLSLFLPYTDTNGGLEPVSFQTTGWQVVTPWLAGTQEELLVLLLAVFLVLVALLVLLLAMARAHRSFSFAEKHPLLSASIALCHLFNLVGFLFSHLLLIFAFLSSGDLYGPFQSVDAAFGIPPVAFLLALLGSSLLLGQALEPQRRAEMVQDSVLPL